MTPLRTLGAGVVVMLASTGCAGSQPAGVDAPTSNAPQVAFSSAAALTEIALPFPLPAGEVLTPAGSELGIRAAATVAWHPTQDSVGLVRVQLRGYQIGRIRDFRGFELDANALASTPVYLRAAITNLGPDPLSGRALPLFIHNDTGQLIPASEFGAQFRPCQPAQLPADFATGQQAEVCLVYMLPERGTVAGVVWSSEATLPPVTWRPPGP